MLQLVKKIDNAWKHSDILLNVDPKTCISYFDFRNKVVLKYNRKHIEREAF